MKMTAVKSSNINAIGYDTETKELHVEFKSGKTFCYKDVTPLEARELVKSDSVGKHFNQYIKAVKVGLEVVICITDDIEEEALSEDLTQKMYLLLGECLMSLHHNPELQDKIAAVRKDVRGN